MRAAIWAAFGLTILIIGRAEAQTLCQNPNRFCGQLIETDCLQRLGAAQRASGSADCDGQMKAYRECLQSAAECPSGGVQSAGPRCDAQISRELWELAEKEEDCAGFEAYLAECPDAPRARFARIRLRKLGCDGQGKSAEAQTQAVVAAAGPGAVDFGDDSSQWANDGECDDPRFVGDGADDVLLEDDLMHDSTDCRTLFRSGKIRLKPPAPK